VIARRATRKGDIQRRRRLSRESFQFLRFAFPAIALRSNRQAKPFYAKDK